MSVLKKYFDKKINQSSPVQVDYNRVCKYDEDGKEFIVFEKVDYPKIQKSNGKVKDWTLDALLAAGINPNFPLHTGYNTRIEGVDVIKQAEATADAIFADLEKNNE